MDFFTYSTPMFLAALVEIIKMLGNCGGLTLLGVFQNIKDLPSGKLSKYFQNFPLVNIISTSLAGLIFVISWCYDEIDLL